MFTHCCRAGRVRLLQPRYEDWYREYFSITHPHFLRNIRNYNASLSFASLGCNIVAPPNRGPYCYQVNGMVHHNIPINQQNDPQGMRYAQIYFMDSTTQATEQRMAHVANQGLYPHVLREFHIYFMAKNKHAMMFKSIHEEYPQLGVAEQLQLVFNDDDQARQQLPGIHPGRINAPTAGNEIAAVFPMNNNEEGIPDYNRNIRLFRRRDNEVINITINVTSKYLDPFCYAVLFPCGEEGWHTNYRGIVNDPNSPRISLQQYRAAQIQVRNDLPLRNCQWSPIVHARNLFQQFAVDAYLGIESNNLTWIRLNQNTILADEYVALNRYIERQAQQRGARALPSVIVPSTFTGSARFMRQLTLDAMSIFGRFGKPDLFITFTCNPKWPEIVDNLDEGEQPHDRPDLTCRVFNLKLKAMIQDIKDGLFGPMLCYVYTIEFQKRGLPHAHILVTLQQGHKLTTPESIDRVVCAMLPDRARNPRLYEIVTRCMIHGPCSPNLCQQEDRGVLKCKKGFPKAPCAETRVVQNDYPQYKRVYDANQPQTYTHRGQPPNNLHVVPYNAFLLLKYNAHINVEVVSNMLSAIKYVYKYIFKGFDMANLVVTRDGTIQRDEVKDFISGRYVSANEAIWRIYEFSTHDRSHAVIRLPLHLERQTEIEFNEDMQEVLQDPERRMETKLTAFFRLNTGEEVGEPEPPTPLLYAEVGVQYVWDSARRRWKKRQQRESSIVARIQDYGNAFSEIFALRMLLISVRGPKSFEDIRTVNDVIHPKFHDAAQALNLIRNDNAFFATFDELATKKMPRQLRMFFVHMLLSFTITRAFAFWDRYKDEMIADFRRDRRYNGKDDAYLHGLALWDIQQRFLRSHKTNATFNLPPPPVLRPEEMPCRRYIEPNVQEMQGVIPPDPPQAQAQDGPIVLNPAQQQGFDRIMGAVRKIHQQRIFVIIGPGGSGKTTLYKEIMRACRALNLKVCPFATTGIAATLMEGGMTAHRGFGLPLNADNTSRSALEINPDHPLRKTLEEAALILIDEITMMSRFSLQIIDRVLKKIMNDPITPFGGKIFVVGGDFRQLLPVVPGATRAQILFNCVISSDLWVQFERIVLNENMRAMGDQPFIDWLLSVGTGQTAPVPGLDSNVMEIPQEMILEVPPTDPTVAVDPEAMSPALEAMIEKVFGADPSNLTPRELAGRAILTTTLSEVMKVNNHVIENMNQQAASTYLSADTLFSDDGNAGDTYGPELLHRLQPSGLPPHKLVLKQGALVMLIRNLDPEEGLSNGTRLIIVQCLTNAVIAMIVSECNRDEIVYIGRTEMSAMTTYGFTLQRQQLPLLPSYAMTINKSQGQTLQRVGLYLNDTVFSHGQLYVALSRCRNRDSIFVHISDCGARQGYLLRRFPEHANRIFTRNIIYKEVFVHQELRPNEPQQGSIAAMLEAERQAQQDLFNAELEQLLVRLDLEDRQTEEELEAEAVRLINELEQQQRARLELNNVEPADEQMDVNADEDDDQQPIDLLPPVASEPPAEEINIDDLSGNQQYREDLHQPDIAPYQPEVCIANALNTIGSFHLSNQTVRQQLRDTDPNEAISSAEDVFSYGRLFDL